MTLTYLLFSIATLAVAPLLTSSFFPPLLPPLAGGRCFRTWVLITYQFYKPPRFFRSFSPTNVLFLQFSESSRNDFAFYFESHCPSAEEYSSLFLSSAAGLFISLILNALLTIWCSGQTAFYQATMDPRILVSPGEQRG